MKHVKFFLERWGIHSFLLPAFFILHSYKQYYGLISADTAIKIFVKILLIFFVVFLILLASTRNKNKSLQLLTLLGIITLFFGVIKDFFQFTLHAYFLSRYIILLPLLLVVTIILTRKILRKKDFQKTNLFQNTLLLIFILIDIILLFASSNSFSLKKNLLTKNSNLSIDSLPPPSSTPDVYYIVLDCYPGTSFQKNYMKYDNASFDAALTAKGFTIIAEPRSNYNRTAFSIAATLNFEYLQKIKNTSPITPRNYNQAILTVKESEVPQVFKKNKYAFYNLSVFNIDETPPIYKESFLTLPEQNVLLNTTIIERIRKDLLWNFISGKHAISFLQKIFAVNKSEFNASQEKKRGFNETVVDSLQKIAEQKAFSPKFIYAHLYLPHPPFFYDENGKPNDLSVILKQDAQEDKMLFLGYLKYTNKVILKLTDKIMQTTGGKAVIILQSDHGFTDFADCPTDPDLIFRNYSAFYFPDRNYTGLYNTMSNVNTFPVVFNKYFNTKIPLQKDSSTLLSY